MSKNFKKVKQTKKSVFYENNDYKIQLKDGGYVMQKNDMFKPWYRDDIEEGEYFNAMLRCLEQEHDIQQDLFEMMHAKGYYPTPAADEKKIQNTIQTFSQCVKNI